MLNSLRECYGPVVFKNFNGMHVTRTWDHFVWCCKGVGAEVNFYIFKKSLDFS